MFINALSIVLTLSTFAYMCVRPPTEKNTEWVAFSCGIIIGLFLAEALK